MKLDADDVLAICGIVIAAVAVWVAVWQGIIARRHNRLSVRPSIKADVYLSDEAFEIYYVNAGVGPAILTGFAIEVDGRPVHGTGYSLVEAALGQLSLADVDWKSHEPHLQEAISAGERSQLLRLESGGDPDFADRMFRTMSRLKYRVTYQSIYGEEWMILLPQWNAGEAR